MPAEILLTSAQESPTISHRHGLLNTDMEVALGWDVFISHASEDKARIAVPLKAALEQAGISAWIDLEQIKLGDSFPSAIDLGLQRCRFGLLLLSPRFFQKPWAKAELDAFLAMELSAAGQKRLLPIVCDMSFDDLREHSPLLASRRAMHWADGIDKIVGAIAEVVTGTPQVVSPPPTASPMPSHPPVALDALVLLLLKSGRMVYSESLDVESRADGMDITLKCNDASDAALIHELSRSSSERVIAVFDTTVVIGRVSDARIKRSGSQQTGIVQIKSEPSHSNLMEMSFAGISPDKLAELRARRILLNEQLPGHQTGSQFDFINHSLLDQFVAGFDTPLKATDSPIPKLYERLSGNPALFVAVARLASVMMLSLSNTVELILRLDLRLEGEQLHVDFAGQRTKKFMNVDPPIIEVKGTLDLEKFVV